MFIKKKLRKYLRTIKIILGKDLNVKRDYKCNYQRMGSDYGGWDINMDILDESSIVYSMGVGEDISFDTELIDQVGLTVHAFDPTPRSVKWIQSRKLPQQFIMHAYGISDIDGDISFYPPKNQEHISHTILGPQSVCDQGIKVPVKRLETIMLELDQQEVDVLKMDIEGAEYVVIKDIESSNIRPNQLLIEFHHRFEGVGPEKTEEAISVIKNMGYGLYSVSDNGEEYSFIKRGLLGHNHEHNNRKNH